MRRKIIVSLIVIFIIAVCGVILLTPRGYDRTDEDYIAIFLDNREDFEYIAQIMQQWEKGWISFKMLGSNIVEEIEIDNKFFTNNREMADEILNNEIFYTHLMNLIDLQEIYDIDIDKDWGAITFSFSKNPTDCRVVLYYILEDKRLGGSTSIIDEHWILQIIPNI